MVHKSRFWNIVPPRSHKATHNESFNSSQSASSGSFISSAPGFISSSIYPFKKTWTNFCTTPKHDNPLKLSSGNAETPSHRGMRRSDRKTRETWVQMMQCVKFLRSWILCAWIFLSRLFFLTIGKFLHNFSPRFPKGQLLTCGYVISSKEFLEAFGSGSAWIIQDR